MTQSMASPLLPLALAAFVLSFFAGCAASAPMPSSSNTPIVAGHGVGTFQVGELLYATDFSDTENWTLQIDAAQDSQLKPRVLADNGMLDIYAPQAGVTGWLNRSFSGPIAITYRVRCPLETQGDPGIQARDINNFWHASDPTRERGVFDAQQYTGSFRNYSEMRAYYASSGGGGKIGNRTTRFRRYPRAVAGQPVPHLALNNQDGNPDHLITPGKWHTVQLVAYNGLAQYLLDGEVVYEIHEGDEVIVEGVEGDDPRNRAVTYTREAFPAHTSGHFGLRMVATHHQYTDLTIHRLVPAGR